MDRVAACLKACDGIETRHLEQMLFTRTLRENAHSYAKLEQHRDALLAALQAIVALDDGDNAALWPHAEKFEAAREAIAMAPDTTA
jgi:hypothetical protein